MNVENVDALREVNGPESLGVWVARLGSLANLRPSVLPGPVPSCPQPVLGGRFRVRGSKPHVARDRTVKEGSIVCENEMQSRMWTVRRVIQMQSVAHSSEKVRPAFS